MFILRSDRYRWPAWQWVLSGLGWQAALVMLLSLLSTGDPGMTFGAGAVLLTGQIRAKPKPSPRR
jgi:hypothetical protein